MPPSGLKYPKGRSPRWKFLPKKLAAHFINVEIDSPPLQVTTSISATVIVTNSLVLTMPMPVLQMTGHWAFASLVLTMPVPEVSIHGLTGEIGDLRLAMPMPTLYMAQGGTLQLTMPVPTLQMTGLNGAVGRILLRGVLPSLNMTAYLNEVGVLNLTLHPPMLLMTGYLNEIGNLILSLNPPEILMHGLSGSVGSLSLELNPPSLLMTGYLNEIGALNLTLHPPVLLMTGKENEIGSLVLTLNPPQLSMYGISGFIGSLSLQLKPPRLLMSGFIEAKGSLVLTMPVPYLAMTGDQFFATRYFKGLVMNMSHFAVTDYIGYDFNSLAYFNGEFLGGGQTGISALGGNKDNGTNINFRAKMPVLDPYQNILKKARDAWLTCRSDGQLMLVVQMGEKEYYDDTFEPTGRVDEYRCKLPKGIKERFLAFEIRNVDGSNFDQNNLRFTTDAITRRRK